MQPSCPTVGQPSPLVLFCRAKREETTEQRLKKMDAPNGFHLLSFPPPPRVLHRHAIQVGAQVCVVLVILPSGPPMRRPQGGHLLLLVLYLRHGNTPKRDSWHTFLLMLARDPEMCRKRPPKAKDIGALVEKKDGRT